MAVMDYLPAVNNGYLPLYLFAVSVAAIGNSLQNFTTLHYTRRIYRGRFVPNPALGRVKVPPSDSKNPEDSVHKLVPASSTGKDVEKAADQMTPLAARLFACWTFVTGVIRLYAAYNVSDPVLYQLSLLTHVVAASHYLSELFIFKTCTFSGPLMFPIFAGSCGSVWMASQYVHYVGPLSLPWLR